MLPGKHVQGTLLGFYSGVEAAKVKSVELAVNKSGWNAFFGILGCLCGELSLNDLKWRAKISILVNFNGVDFLGADDWHETDAVLFVTGPSDALAALLVRLLPLELLQGGTCLGADDKQVFSRFLHVPFFAADDVIIAGRVLESQQVELDKEQTLLLEGQVYEVEADLGNDGGLAPVERGKLGNSGLGVDGERVVLLKPDFGGVLVLIG